MWVGVRGDQYCRQGTLFEWTHTFAGVGGSFYLDGCTIKIGQIEVVGFSAVVLRGGYEFGAVEVIVGYVRLKVFMARVRDALQWGRTRIDRVPLMCVRFWIALFDAVLLSGQ